MPRLCFILALLVGACASHEAPEPYWIPYDGYGQGASIIGNPYSSSVRESTAYKDSIDPNLDVRDISPALDRFLSLTGHRPTVVDVPARS